MSIDITQAIFSKIARERAEREAYLVEHPEVRERLALRAASRRTPEALAKRAAFLARIEGE